MASVILWVKNPVAMIMVLFWPVPFLSALGHWSFLKQRKSFTCKGLGDVGKGVGDEGKEKPKPNLITLNFFSVALQLLRQNSVIARQLQFGIFVGPFRITLVVGFWCCSEMLILVVCMLVHAGAWGVWDLALPKHMKLDSGLPQKAVHDLLSD